MIATLLAFILAQAAADNGSRVAIISAISAAVAALIGAGASVIVVLRNGATQTALAESARKAELEARKSEAAAAQSKTDREASAILVEGLSRDNQRLRDRIGECDNRCDEIMERWRQTESERHATLLKLNDVEAENARLLERVSTLEAHVRVLEGKT